MADFKGIAESLIAGDAGKVKNLVQAAVDEGVTAQKILDEGLISGMEVVGIRFKNCEIYVPEVLVSARAMHAGMDILEPLLAKAGVKARGTFVVGTVKGDLHDIGKNLVAMMLKGAGWKVVDLGVDVDAEKFVQTAIKEDADVIGLSALLTTTMVNMKSVIELAKNKDCKSKVVVGGAPLTQSYADEIGANGYAPDAATAVEIVNKLVHN
ncbi:MAG: methyltransferase [Spirochaetes bacterium DG_61]|jgi:5-methyltetrahydrofolate--homocysteine methyltransferase|nr:MAG: methyltransferase [Spirochaetes bacterium DG_61]